MLKTAAVFVLVLLLIGGGYLYYLANVGYIDFDDVHTSVLGKSQSVVYEMLGNPRGKEPWSDRTDQAFWNVREPTYTALYIFFFDDVAGHLQIAKHEAYPAIDRLKSHFGSAESWRVSSVRNLNGDEFEAWVSDVESVVIYESHHFIEVAFFNSPFVEDVK